MWWVPAPVSKLFYEQQSTMSADSIYLDSLAFFTVFTSQHSFELYEALFMNIYMYIFVNTYIHTHTHIHVCVCVYIYIYIYIFLGDSMATHSSILAWRIPWTEEPGRLQSIVSQRVRHCWSDLALHDMHTHTHTYIYIYTHIYIHTYIYILNKVTL